MAMSCVFNLRRGFPKAEITALAIRSSSGQDDELLSKKMTPVRPIITTDLDILAGTPVFFGTGVPLQALLDYVDGGSTLDEFLDDFPIVSREAALVALEELRER